jgi:DNA-binding response OmpR family regulator
MRKRILVVDNDEAVLYVLKEALSYDDFEVKTTETADNIWADIDEFKPTLLLIDYILSGINGGEICRRVKMNQKTSHLPVIIISAYPRALLSLGNYECDKFIPKPFDLYDLTAQINDCINRRQIIPVSISS